MRLNTLILKIHTYIGLQAVVALLIFALAVIAVSINNKNEPELTYHQFEGDISLTNIELAKILHKQVGLRFETIPQWWMISEKSTDILVVKFKSPAAKREVILNKISGNIEIRSWPMGVSDFANHMHQESIGRRKAADSLWLWAWSLYIEFSILALFALPITGLYIWVSRKSPKELWGKVSLLCSSVAMIILWISIR